ncbi:transposase, partial [Bilophila wadsworthia]|uniref:transposase n=1 Tax=Bilophila wadsworthia TaxID=35833 RepID=UPI0026481EDA
RCIGRTKGGLNTKLHVVCDFDGRSIRTLLTAGTISDYGGAACLLPTLPSTRILLADRGYDAGWIRSFLKNRGCTPCIPSRKNTRVMSIATRNNISSITR